MFKKCESILTLVDLTCVCSFCRFQLSCLYSCSTHFSFSFHHVMAWHGISNPWSKSHLRKRNKSLHIFLHYCVQLHLHLPKINFFCRQLKNDFKVRYFLKKRNNVFITSHKNAVITNYDYNNYDIYQTLTHIKIHIRSVVEQRYYN